MSIRIAALVILGAVSAAIMLPVPLSGDENSYYAGAEALGLWVRSLITDSAAPDVVGDVVQNGWFMPGMSILLSPVFVLLGAGVPVIVVRLTALGINLCLVGFISHRVERLWGSTADRIFLMILLSSPYYILFLATAWSDLVSLHLALLGLFWIHHQFFVDQAPSPVVGEGVRGGLLVAGLTYMRGLYPATYLVLVIANLLRWIRLGATRPQLRQPLASAAISGAVALLLLSPWIAATSARFGQTFTVTSSSLSKIVWFADPDYIERAQEETGVGPIFHAVQALIVNNAEANSTTYMEEAAAEEERVLSGRSRSQQFADLKLNFRRYYAVDDATPFMQRFFRLRCNVSAACLPDALQTFLFFWANWSWRLLLVGGVVVLVIPYRIIRTEDAFPAFLWKALVVLLALHPFVVMAHERYYAQFVPLFALGVCWVITKNAPVQRLTGGTKALTLNDLMVSVGQMAAIAVATFSMYLTLG